MLTRMRIPLLLLSWAEKDKQRSNKKRERWADLAGEAMSDWQLSQRIRNKHGSHVKNINTVQRERGKGILLIESQWMNGQGTRLGGGHITVIYNTADTLFKQGQGVGFRWILCPWRPASIWTFLAETTSNIYVIIKSYVFNCKKMVKMNYSIHSHISWMNIV